MRRQSFLKWSRFWANAQAMHSPASARSTGTSHCSRNNLRSAQLRKLTRNFPQQIFVGNYRKLAGGRERQQTRHSLLNHGLLAVEREQLLSAALATQRPEARTASACEDYRIKIRFGHVQMFKNLKD